VSVRELAETFAASAVSYLRTQTTANRLDDDFHLVSQRVQVRLQFPCPAPKPISVHRLVGCRGGSTTTRDSANLPGDS
jgi:hypothetical protein